MTADALTATVARLRELLQNDEGGTMSVWSVSSYIADEFDRLTAALAAMRAENERLTRERDGWKADAERESINRDYWRAENEALREELLSQWESNHFEHCGIIPPCSSGLAGPRGCQWPRPTILDAALARAAQEEEA